MPGWDPAQLDRVMAEFVGVDADGGVPEVACGLGRVPTGMPRLRFFWSTVSARATSVVDAGIVILLSGSKVGHIRQRRFVYDADHYLVVSASIPYEYAAEASREAPLAGIFVEIDLAELNELVRVVGPGSGGQSDDPIAASGLGAVPLDDAMRDVVRRILHAMLDRRDGVVLGPALVREVVYRALLGPGGAALRLLTRSDTREARLAQLVLALKRDIERPWTVPALARRAAMSVTTFHRAFKRFTGETPLQYIKRVRLHKASGLLIYDGLSVKEASAHVGYESPTQFSREFKRLFGQPPSALRRLGAGRPQPQESP